MTVRGAAFLGVGAMVGAGIFALLGQVAVVAGSAVWLSFLLAGIVAALLGYTVVKLGVRYPSSGGLFAYLMQGFGNGRLVGISAWLGYFAAIVIVCSMVAVSFGSYATSLFVGDDAGSAWDNVFTTLVVVAMAGISIVGSALVSRAQSLIVFALLAVFAVFIVVTLSDIDFDLLAFSGYPPVSDIVASVALTFFAYLGFSVITFAAGDMRDPERELPKAMYRALGVTTILYVLISIGVLGTLTVAETIAYGETAIAEAARPALGDAGFTMMAIAALLATASSVNATLYASGGLTAMLSESGQFPPLLGRRSRLGPHAGVLVTAALVLVVANTVDLSAIASVGSACSLMIFLLIGVAAFRLRSEIGANAAVVLVATAATAVVLVFFAVDTLRNAPETFLAIIAIALLAVVLDLVWKRDARRAAARRGGTRRTGRTGVGAGARRHTRVGCRARYEAAKRRRRPAVPRDARLGAERDRRDRRRRRDAARGDRAVVRAARRPVQRLPDIRPAYARPGEGGDDRAHRTALRDAPPRSDRRRPRAREPGGAGRGRTDRRDRAARRDPADGQPVR